MPVNRINPGVPPSRRPGAVVKREGSPLDRVSKISHAIKEMLRQKALVGKVDRDSADYDLTAIWKAAKNDPGNQGHKHITPKRFVEEYDHMVKALDDSDPGKVMVDSGAACAYCALVDHRVQMAQGDHMMQQSALEIAADPIQAGVDACNGGPIMLMFSAIPATNVTGMSPEAYFEAVLDRAKEQAAKMEERAGETLLSNVLKAIAGCPDLATVVHSGPFPDDE